MRYFKREVEATIFIFLPASDAKTGNHSNLVSWMRLGFDVLRLRFNVLRLGSAGLRSSGLVCARLRGFDAFVV